jgi:beta-phosphoglucomutase
MIKAFLFDLNGTMIDDMQYHYIVWHKVLNDLGANISLEKTKEQSYGKNVEMLERIFPARFTDEEKSKIGFEKEKAYQQIYTPHIKLIDGLNDFLQEAKSKQIKMAIGSAAIQFNIDFVLDALSIRHYFDAIISADDVKESKPNAETFLKCAAALGVRPNECIVFEDVPKGVESAQNAGMNCVVITTMYRQESFLKYNNILSYVESYNELNVDDIL